MHYCCIALYLNTDTQMLKRGKASAKKYMPRQQKHLWQIQEGQDIPYILGA